METERDRPLRNARVRIGLEKFIQILRAGGVDIPEGAQHLGVYTGLISDTEVTISWGEFTDV